MLLIASCSLKEKDSNDSITQAIPKNSELIIKFHNINKINNKINNFEWWKKLRSTTSINTNLRILSSLNKAYNINEIFDNNTIYLSSV